MALMQHVVSDMYLTANLAARTIQQMVSAVTARLAETDQGKLRDFAELRAQTEGVARALGMAVQKKACTSDEDIHPRPTY